LIDRINWRYAANAVSAVWDSKYYLAVPLDDAEVLGPERAINGLGPVSSSYTLVVTAGRRYRWVGDTNETLTNGTQTVVAASDFTAQGSSVTVSGASAVVANTSLREVFGGVLNAVIVYDFLNGAWVGHDEAEGFAFSEFRQINYGGRLRLFAVTSSGFLVMYEEDFEDQLPVPYTDLGMLLEDVDETIQVNGGATITMGAGGNGATTLGLTGTLAITRNNLFCDSDVTDGYYAGCATTVWSAPNTLVTKTATGVRFYGTNGVVPVVTVLSPPPSTLWTITVTNTQPITATLTTRGYSSPSLALDSFEWLTFDLQTWAPRTTVEVLTSGVNETETVLDAQTRSRTSYFEPSDAAAFTVTNVNGDFLTPYREDYSVLLGTGTASGEAADFALYTVTGGVPLGLHQEIRVTERIQASGRSAQVKFTNDQGRMRLMSVLLEANEDTFSSGAKA
jgi:hypothetical protein